MRHHMITWNAYTAVIDVPEQSLHMRKCGDICTRQQIQNYVSDLEFARSRAHATCLLPAPIQQLLQTPYALKPNAACPNAWS